jgi:hypothetical protein
MMRASPMANTSAPAEADQSTSAGIVMTPADRQHHGMLDRSTARASRVK